MILYSKFPERKSLYSLLVAATTAAGLPKSTSLEQ